MARRRKVNPCKMKGRYGGRLHAGRYYELQGVKVAVGQCECNISFFAAKSDSPRLCYAMEVSSGEVAFKACSGEEPDSGQKIVPCKEKFRQGYFAATVKYRAAIRGARFRGCQDVEDYLVHLGLVLHEPRELLGKVRDVREHLDLLESKREWVEAADGVGEVFVSGDELDGIDAEALQRSSWDMADLINPTGEGKLSKSELIRGFHDNPEHAAAWRLWWESLTRLQKNAVRACILDNYQDRSLAEIAKRFGISRDSLKDRLAGAFSKLPARV